MYIFIFDFNKKIVKQPKVLTFYYKTSFLPLLKRNTSKKYRLTYLSQILNKKKIIFLIKFVS